MYLDYSDEVMDHFQNPRNIGEIQNPDGYGEVGNPICGDMLAFFIKVKDNKISKIKFSSFGCASNIATASILTEKAKGMDIKEAKKIQWKDLVKELKGLPKQKNHCSIMAIEGLKEAIKDYEKNQD